MPFDALAMRAVETRWRRDLIGAVCVKAQQSSDRLLLTLRTSTGTAQVLVVLQPGIQRLHRTSRQSLPDKRPIFPWLQKIVPFAVLDIHVPPFERVMEWRIQARDDWGQDLPARLIFELAGHLTNIVLVDEEGLVVDAWRKVPPGRPGRHVWPRLAYQPPPPLANPLDGRDATHLPPWARRWLEDGHTWETLEQDFTGGFSASGWILTNAQNQEVWVYPVPGYERQPAQDFEEALDLVFQDKERRRQREALAKQLSAEVQGRIAHLTAKLSQYQQDRLDDGANEKALGDLWLTYQYAFKADPTLSEMTVAGFDGKPRTLVLEENQTPADAAAGAYRRYKKAKARQEALDRLIPILDTERQHLQKILHEAQEDHPLDWYKAQLKTNALAKTDQNQRLPYRRFQSLHGLEILVGKNRDENAKLTFQKARPDDIWLHAKQAPGSHVILATGRTNPDLEDLLDAAELAVFFSSAQDSSSVPVDYTRRKFVRKRPHGEPGQVLYQREKTLYITPSPERLRRLGAISEKLAES